MMPDTQKSPKCVSITAHLFYMSQPNMCAYSSAQQFRGCCQLLRIGVAVMKPVEALFLPCSNIYKV